MTTIKNFLDRVETSYKHNAGAKRWNSVSPPFTYWPSIDNINEWNKEPVLKLKRLDMWQFFAEKMKEHGIKSNVDIGGASGQFTVLQHKQGIESYCVDPQAQFLYSNTEDFRNHNVSLDYLYLGDFENFIKLAKTSDIHVDCVSFLNFMHGWNGTDAECLDLVESVKGMSDYILTSLPQSQPQTLNYIHQNTDVALELYHQIDQPRETHFLIKWKK